MYITQYSLRLIKEKTTQYNFRDTSIDCVDRAYDAICDVLKMNDEPFEKFGVVLLNPKKEIVGISMISTGTVDSNVITPCDVFKPALLANVKSIIIFHNHPSGNPTPSIGDRCVTKTLVDCGKMLAVEVLDHVIVGDCGCRYSFAEDGKI